MISPVVMATIRQFDQDCRVRLAAGRATTAQYHRHLLIREVDRLTRELDAVRKVTA